MNAAKDKARNRKAIFVAGLALVILLAGQAAAMIFLVQGSWIVRLRVVLEILGFYNVGLGLVTGSELIRKFSDFGEEMSSPDLLKYIRGNLLFFTTVFSVSSLALSPSSRTSFALGCLGNLLMLIVLPVLLVYALFHFVVIMPIAYIGFLLSSSVIENIVNAETDIHLQQHQPSGESNALSIKDLIAANPVRAKAFLVGVPAIALSMVLSVVALLGGAQAN